jgi:hypothetical protein
MNPRVVVPASTTFLHLPFAIRHRIYEYAGLFGYAEYAGPDDNRAICLNYRDPGDDRGPGHERDPDDPDPLDDRDADDVQLDGVPWHRYGLERFIQCGSFEENVLSDYSRSVSRFLDGYLQRPVIPLERFCCERAADRYNPFPCSCEVLPSQLLDVSRSIAREVKAVFFSENPFFVDRSLVGGLSVLQRLGTISLSYITSLTIALSETCHWYCMGEFTGLICPWRGKMLDCGHKVSLAAPPTKGEESDFLKWKRCCNQLASVLEPKRLKLCFSCEVTDMDTAKKYTTPLLRLPELRECAIRLGGNPENHSLQELAEMTAIQMKHRPISRQALPFRLMDLPNEIRLMILEATDLVTPFALAWSPYAAPNETRLFEIHAIEGFGTVDPGWYRFACCRSCSEYRCYCWTRQAAFSTTCTCWKVPIALFRVSSSFREDALSVFYNKNHFVVLPMPREQSGEIGILKFLKRMPMAARRYLRSVRWILPMVLTPYDYQYKEFRILEFYQDWVEAMAFCARELKLEQLSLTVDMSFQISGPYTDILKAATWEWRIALCMSGVMALHKGWKNVFFHLFEHEEDWPINIRIGRTTIEAWREEREEILERRVMGQDYDACSRGKFDENRYGNGYNL